MTEVKHWSIIHYKFEMRKQIFRWEKFCNEEIAIYMYVLLDDDNHLCKDIALMIHNLILTRSQYFTSSILSLINTYKQPHTHILFLSLSRSGIQVHEASLTENLMVVSDVRFKRYDSP